jgi:glycosyltransferase involved in cell wall biosynthesis
VELHTSRNDGHSVEPFPLHSAVSWPLSTLPHRILRPFSVPRAHRSFLDALKPGDIAYLWPSVPFSVYAALHDRGVPIVAEAINTLMRDARAVLDAEFDRLGRPPTHTITQERIDEEEASLGLATAVFSPSPATDRSFARSAFAAKAVATSYGVWSSPARKHAVVRQPQDRVTFLFVGISTVRKGLQRLLETWRDVPPQAHLRIVGLVDPIHRELFSDVLRRPNVSVAGYTHDIASEYRSADVFVLPSLEEGDPIATYEAASWALPLLVSPAGAGRFGAETGAADIIDPADVALIRQKVVELTVSGDLRLHRGAMAHAAVEAYDWPLVAARRLARLDAFLAARGQPPSA